ncbi:phage tail protein [Pseudovibrio sp. SPO723]|uniref:phage tail protein n=1 Tax=Nesiotobacter zosterae TaxID=392721 RepID=UPI0029C3C69A|nr:tail fiber protein [Pseudovibrio sp. SPO723]MDX5594304.1 tail fiber protein [Pseudovibrio sp. SPO723]
MGQPFISQISLWGLNFAVEDWAFCDGQTLNISQYAALYSLLGTKYGGNGTSTFSLPNLKGRIATGLGYPGEDRGTIGGTETVTLTEVSMPAHTHRGTVLTVADDPGTSGPATGLVMANPTVTRPGSSVVGSSFSEDGSLDASFSAGNPTESVGSSTPFSVRSPFLAVNYEIALEGVYPSRD